MGQTKSFGAGDRDVYLFETDSSGSLRWEQVFGGMQPDGGFDLLPRGDGCYSFAGYTESFGAGNEDMYVVTLCAPNPSSDPFLRGDCNDDGTVDISDAVSTLGFLFLGNGDPDCDDSCDSNDDGTIDISDAVTTLEVLFLGAGTVPLPGVDRCGVDPTDDEIGCDTFERCP